MAKYLLLTILSMLLIPFSSLAETVNIIDNIKVGLHADAKINSPIIKILPTGSALEIQQRGVDMSKVKDQEGNIGWVNTAYLSEQTVNQTNNGANQKVQALETELSRAETEIKQLKHDLSNVKTIQESKELKSMKLKVAELEAKLSKQKKSTKSTNTTDSSHLSAELEATKQRNMELEQIVSDLKNQTANSNPRAQTPVNISKTLLWIILFAIVIGIVLGMVLLDFYKRRQHGGFRV